MDCMDSVSIVPITTRHCLSYPVLLQSFYPNMNMNTKELILCRVLVLSMLTIGYWS